MVDVKDAANTASGFLKSFFPTAKRVRLEEVELSDDRSLWNITLSYALDEGGVVIGYQTARHYKLFSINANTGEVLSMKIREIK